MSKMTDGSHECLLRDVFSIFTIPELPYADRQHGTLETLDELSNGRLITGQTAFGEFPIVHESFTLPKSIPLFTLNGFSCESESRKNPQGKGRFLVLVNSPNDRQTNLRR